jgi:hypothetical protein
VANFFDELSDIDHEQAQNDKPFWAIKKESDDETMLKWLNDDRRYLEERNRVRFQEVEKNLLQYKGVQYAQQETRQDTRSRQDDRSRSVQKIVINQVYDLTESRIARRVKYKPAVEISPLTDDISDKFAAQECQALVEHIQMQERFADTKLNKWVMNCDTMGEAFLFVDWDPFKGDEHPEYKKLSKANKGNPFKLNIDGKEIDVDEPVMLGDVSYELELTTNILAQWKEDWEQVDYIHRKKTMHIEEVKNLWPESSGNIKEMDEASFYDYTTNQSMKLKNHVEVFYFWHRKTRFLPKGAKIVYTKNTILEKGDFPFRHKRLPCVRLSDIDRPGEPHGQSFISHIKPITGLRNTLTNMIVRNQTVCAHPKWMMPAGSAKLESLGNDITIVQYKGPVAPQLVQASPTSAEVFKFREDLKMEAIQTAQLSGVAQGTPPPGVNAGVALQWMSEQENERFNRAVLKFGAAIVEVAELTIDVAASMYEAEDHRIIKVMGKNQAWKQKVFDIKNLEPEFDIKIRNSSALPREKPARIQTLMDLNKQFPDKITGEQVLDQLDLAQDMKYLNIVTISVQAAETENNNLLDPRIENVPEPEEFEDQIVHWRIHAQQVRNYGFKTNTPEALKSRMSDHVMAHEMLMWQVAQIDPGYQAKLAALEGWPMFYRPDLPQPMPSPDLSQMQSVQGGQELSTALPNDIQDEVAPATPSVPAQLGVGSVDSQVQS